MQRRLFSWINTKMFFKLIFKNRGLVCQSEVAAAFFVWPVRDAVCAIKPPGRAAQKLVTRHKTRTRPVRVGDHRFEDCSPCLELRAEPSTTSSTRPPHEAGPGCRARRARHTAHGAALTQQVRVNAVADAAAARAKQAVATSKGGRDVVAAPRLAANGTAPAPRRRFVRIRRALMSRGDGVLVW
jgi:hypothetical protein